MNLKKKCKKCTVQYKTHIGYMFLCNGFDEPPLQAPNGCDKDGTRKHH